MILWSLTSSFSLSNDEKICQVDIIIALTTFSYPTFSSHSVHFSLSPYSSSLLLVSSLNNEKKICISIILSSPVFSTPPLSPSPPPPSRSSSPHSYRAVMKKSVVWITLMVFQKFISLKISWIFNYADDKCEWIRKNDRNFLHLQFLFF